MKIIPEMHVAGSINGNASRSVAPGLGVIARTEPTDALPARSGTAVRKQPATG
jgi:hypothetical protein